MCTQKEMPVTTNNLISEGRLEKWPYLKEIKIPYLNSGVDLLIGTNASKLMEPWEVINSQGDGPYATRILLGWVINGPLQGSGLCEGDHLSIHANKISIDRIEELLANQKRFQKDASFQKEYTNFLSDVITNSRSHSISWKHRQER